MQVVLIDAKNALFRYGWANSTLRTKDKKPTGACYGILRCLLRLKKRYPAAKFVACWEGRGKTWRHRLFSDYKARTGIPKPEVAEILQQIPWVQMLLAYMGVSEIGANSVEADDVIGILATRLKAAYHDVIIYSSDKDFMQLMIKGVKLIRDVDKKKSLTPEDADSVREIFGCKLKDLLKVRVLLGDPSDNIPGVQYGLGPKTAARMVAAGIHQKDFTPAVWQKIVRNFRLMRLCESPEDAVFTVEEQRTLTAAVDRVVRELEGDCVQAGKNYNDLLQLLGELELSEALEARERLFKIQN